jgi:putative transposase
MIPFFISFLTCLSVFFRSRYNLGREILRFNVTEHPTGPWIMQQLREAFPESCSYRYLILDRDAKFGTEVIDLLAAGGIKPTRTSPANPWQNGISERWIGSCRRELLDHVLIFN